MLQENQPKASNVEGKPFLTIGNIMKDLKRKRKKKKLVSYML